MYGEMNSIIIFRKVVDDPELVVIKFTPDKIEYRDLKTGGMLPENENL